MIELAIQYIQTSSQNHGIYIRSLKFLVPQGSWMEEALTKKGCGIEGEELIVRGGASHMYLIKYL